MCGSDAVLLTLRSEALEVMPQGAGGPRWGSCPSACPCCAPVHGGPSWFLSGAWCVSRSALGLALGEQRGVWTPHGHLPGMCCSPAACPPGPLPQLWEAQAPGRPGPPGAHPAARVPGSWSLLSPQYVCMTASPRKASTTWSSTCKCLAWAWGVHTLPAPGGQSPDSGSACPAARPAPPSVFAVWVH